MKTKSSRRLFYINKFYLDLLLSHFTLSIAISLFLSFPVHLSFSLSCSHFEVVNTFVLNFIRWAVIDNLKLVNQKLVFTVENVKWINNNETSNGLPPKCLFHEHKTIYNTYNNETSQLQNTQNMTFLSWTFSTHNINKQFRYNYWLISQFLVSNEFIIWNELFVFPGCCSLIHCKHWRHTQ